MEEALNKENDIPIWLSIFIVLMCAKELDLIKEGEDE